MVSKITSKRTANPKNWHKPKIKTVVLILIGCLLAYMFVSPVIKQLALKAQLNSESSEAMEATLSNGKFNQRLEEHRLSLRIESAPVYSAVYTLCYTWSRDGGWIAYTYIYSCGMNYISLFVLPRDTSFQSSDDYLKSIGVTNTKNLTNYFHLTSGNLIHDARNLADNSSLTESIPGYSAINASKNIRLMRETGQRELDSHRTYIVLTDEDTYFTKDIGCARRVIFCVSPLGDN